ncbi:MAG: hypothetical protein ACXVEE_27385 [Polyangiales bacterium]
MRCLWMFIVVVGCSKVEVATDGSDASAESSADGTTTPDADAFFDGGAETLADASTDVAEATVADAEVDAGPKPTGIIDTSDAAGWKWTLAVTHGGRDPYDRFVISGDETLAISQRHLARTKGTSWSALDQKLVYGDYPGPYGTAMQPAASGGFRFVADGVIHRALPGKDFAPEATLPFDDVWAAFETTSGALIAPRTNGHYVRLPKGASAWIADPFSGTASPQVFGDRVLVWSDDGAYHVSSDGGATFGPAVPTADTSYAVVTSKGIVAATTSDLRLYDFATASWKSVAAVSAFEPLVANGDRVFAACTKSGDPPGTARLARSLDGGSTWTILSVDVRRLRIGDGKRLFAWQPTPSISDDDGATFTPLPARPLVPDVASFVEQKKDTIWLRSYGETFRSSDGGKTLESIASPDWMGGPEWDLHPVFPEGALAVEPTSGRVVLTPGFDSSPAYMRDDTTSAWVELYGAGLLATAPGKIALQGELSTDLGKTHFKRPLDGGVIAQGFDATGRFVVAATSGTSLPGDPYPIYATSDGVSWTKTGALPSYAQLVVAPDGTLFSDFDGLVASKDGGVTWTKVLARVVRGATTFLPTGELVTAVHAPLADGTQHVDVLVSTDTGKTFHVRTGDLPHEPAGFGAVGGTIWANLRERGLYALGK